MVDFHCSEYNVGKMVADEQTRNWIKETGIRRVARDSKVNRETVALVANGEPVKPSTLAKLAQSR